MTNPLFFLATVALGAGSVSASDCPANSLGAAITGTGLLQKRKQVRISMSPPTEDGNNETLTRSDDDPRPPLPHIEKPDDAPPQLENETEVPDIPTDGTAPRPPWAEREINVSHERKKKGKSLVQIMDGRPVERMYTAAEGQHAFLELREYFHSEGKRRDEYMNRLKSAIHDLREDRISVLHEDDYLYHLYANVSRLPAPFDQQLQALRKAAQLPKLPKPAYLEKTSSTGARVNGTHRRYVTDWTWTNPNPVLKANCRDSDGTARCQSMASGDACKHPYMQYECSLTCNYCALPPPLSTVTGCEIGSTVSDLVCSALDPPTGAIATQMKRKGDAYTVTLTESTDSIVKAQLKYDSVRMHAEKTSNALGIVDGLITDKWVTLSQTKQADLDKIVGKNFAGSLSSFAKSHPGTASKLLKVFKIGAAFSKFLGPIGAAFGLAEAIFGWDQTPSLSSVLEDFAEKIQAQMTEMYNDLVKRIGESTETAIKLSTIGNFYNVVKGSFRYGKNLKRALRDSLRAIEDANGEGSPMSVSDQENLYRQLSNNIGLDQSDWLLEPPHFVDTTGNLQTCTSNCAGPMLQALPVAITIIETHMAILNQYLTYKGGDLAGYKERATDMAKYAGEYSAHIRSQLAVIMGSKIVDVKNLNQYKGFAAYKDMAHELGTIASLHNHACQVQDEVLYDPSHSSRAEPTNMRYRFADVKKKFTASWNVGSQNAKNFQPARVVERKSNGNIVVLNRWGGRVDLGPGDVRVCPGARRWYDHNRYAFGYDAVPRTERERENSYWPTAHSYDCDWSSTCKATCHPGCRRADPQNGCNANPERGAFLKYCEEKKGKMSKTYDRMCRNVARGAHAAIFYWPQNEDFKCCSPTYNKQYRLWSYGCNGGYKEDGAGVVDCRGCEPDASWTPPTPTPAPSTRRRRSDTDLLLRQMTESQRETDLLKYEALDSDPSDTKVVPLTSLTNSHLAFGPKTEARTEMLREHLGSNWTGTFSKDFLRTSGGLGLLQSEVDIEVADLGDGRLTVFNGNGRCEALRQAFGNRSSILVEVQQFYPAPEKLPGLRRAAAALLEKLGESEPSGLS